jgi:septal ring factor EnvC (AmiA/AmiB activator)
MSDIIERLRGHPGPDDTVTVQFRTMIEQRHEAAAEIERLKTKFFEAVTISQDRAAEIERLRRRLNEVDAQLTAEDHIHARECMALRAEKEAEIERLKAERNTTKRMLEDVLARHGLPRP